MRPDREASTSAVLTVPNLLSFVRIAAVPAIVWSIVHRGTEGAGLLAFAVVASTDWVDGYVARRTGRVSELGKVLDPLADRLIVVAVLLALIVRGAFPAWAAALVLVRDVVVLLAGAALLAWRRVRVQVRVVGKVATFALMVAVPSIAWGRLGLWLGPAASAIGWAAFVVGTCLSYLAAGLYAGDVRRALSSKGRRW
jgi:cardiolipin synthase